jgi:hypothetical protein
MTNQTIAVVFGFAFAATLWYLIECVVFSHRLKKENRAEWEALDRPSLWDVRSQWPLLKIFLGAAPLGPALADYRQQLLRIRVLLAVSFSLMLVVASRTG